MKMVRDILFSSMFSIKKEAFDSAGAAVRAIRFFRLVIYGLKCHSLYVQVLRSMFSYTTILIERKI